jgi:transposase InsO family protein
VEQWGIYPHNELLKIIEQHQCRGSDVLTIESLKAIQPPKAISQQTGGGVSGASTAKRATKTPRYACAAPAALDSLPPDAFIDFADEDHESPFDHDDHVDFNIAATAGPLTAACYAETGRITDAQALVAAAATLAAASDKYIQQAYRRKRRSKRTQALAPITPATSSSPAATAADTKDEVSSDDDEARIAAASQEITQITPTAQRTNSEASTVTPPVQTVSGSTTTTASTVSATPAASADAAAATLTAEEKLLIAMEKRGCTAPATTQARRDLIREVHQRGHFGLKHIYAELFSRKIWWPAMREQIMEELQQCEPCIRYTVTRDGYHPARSPHAMMPGDAWYYDVMQLPAADGGFEYVLVGIDVCSSYTLLDILPAITADEIARRWQEHWATFGYPRQVGTDGASHFNNALTLALTSIHGIEHHFTTAYHPQSNGLVENAVKTAKHVIAKCMGACIEQWPLYLKQLQFYMNTKEKEKTGSTPFALMFGRSPNQFRDYQHDEELRWDSKEWQDHMEKVVSIIWPAVDLRSRQYKEEYIDQLNKQRTPLLQQALLPGTPVVIKDPQYLNVNAASKPATTPTYLPHIFTIVSREASGAYRLRQETGEMYPRSVPIEQLKVLRSRRKRIEPNDVYIIDKIVDRMGTTPATYKYRVRWRGFDEGQDTWEAESQFTDKKFVADFNRQLAETAKRAAEAATQPHTATTQKQ